MSDEKFSLNGISEDDWLRWKHHPVTKVYLRFLQDFERQMCERQIAVLRTTAAAPDQFTMGMFQGRINTVAELYTTDFATIADFYPIQGEEEPDEA